MKFLRPRATAGVMIHKGMLWTISLLLIFYTVYHHLHNAGKLAIRPPATLPHENAPSDPPTSNVQVYSRTLVVAKMLEDDTSWVDRVEAQDPQLTAAVYTVNDANAPLTVPENKGNEVMVYLTYIIDNYFQLSDVSIFMHAHRFTWHNNDFLESDSYHTVQRLRSEHVLQSGYMNLRCHLDPGCPDHIHPTTSSDAGENNDLANIPEAAVIGDSWKKLFPGQQVPTVLSQPCCGQFAVSAERIRNVPLSDYVAYRSWLLNTPLDDHLSGRVWEYVWQFLFIGEWEFCPQETVCYCQGYSICFEEADYQQYFKLRAEARKWEADLGELSGGDNQELSEATRSSLNVAIEGNYQKMNEIKAKVVR
jgi:hypothetical protein